MGTYSNPIVFVGENFENCFEALDFIKQKSLITKEEYEEFKEKINSNYCSLEECLNKKFKHFPRSEPLNYVNGQGYFLGYTIAAYKTKTDMPGFLEDIAEAQNMWRQFFKEDGKVCIDIQTS